MITLRSNQSEPINKAIAFFNEKKPKPSLIVLPTAWGKSILTAFVAKNCTDKLLVLQPSKELLEQNYKKYLSLCGFVTNAGIYSASFGRKDIAQITYATIGSIKSLGATFKQMGFTKMLIDEAHLYPRESDSMLGKFLEESGITHVLGITATPVKLQTNRDLDGNTFSKLVMLTSRSKKGNFFKDIIHVGQVREMVELGFWSKLVYQAADFDDSMLVFNSSKSEYTEYSVQQAYNANNGAGGIIDALNSNKDRKHILVFVPSVQDAIDLSQRYENSAVIYGDMDKRQRDFVISEFRAGRIRVIFNVRVLSTGFFNFSSASRYQLILIHDVIEHISNKEEFFRCLSPLLAKRGIIFWGFPSWQMPFGGHQQICHNRFVSSLPFIHLCPGILYRFLLRCFHETPSCIEELSDIKRCRMTIDTFEQLAEKYGYEITDRQLWFINPHYQQKFHLRPRKLYPVLAQLKYIRNYFSTSCFYITRHRELHD